MSENLFEIRYNLQNGGVESMVNAADPLCHELAWCKQYVGHGEKCKSCVGHADRKRHKCRV